MERPWLKITNLNQSVLQIKPVCVCVCVCVWSYTMGGKRGKNKHSESGAGVYYFPSESPKGRYLLFFTDQFQFNAIWSFIGIKDHIAKAPTTN